METKLRSESEAPTGSRTKDLSCWSTDSSAHCLRVEKPGEIHLFPYGYFQHAKLIQEFWRRGPPYSISRLSHHQSPARIWNPYAAALQRLAVDRIRLLPSAQRTFPKSEGFIEAIEIREPKQKDSQP